MNKLTNTYASMKTWALAHKVLASVLLIVVLGGGYWTYAKATSTAGETRYAVANAAKTTLISSVTGTGQVSSSDQVDVKSKAGGEIISLPVTEGSDVKAGQALAYIDATDAEKAVRDAETALETAQLSLQKLQQPPDQLSLTQSQNSLDKAVTAKQNAEDSLAKTYDDGFNSISNSFLDLPGVMSGLHDLLFLTSNQLGGVNMQNIDFYTDAANNYNEQATAYGKDAYDKYQTALTKYNKNFQDYKSLTRTDGNDKIEAMIAETYDTSLSMSDAVKSANNLIQFYEDQMTQHNQTIPALANTQLATLNDFTSKVNTHLTDLLNEENTIKNDKAAIVDADRTINENTLSLEKLKAGADPLDIRSSQISVQQKEDALTDAKNALADYTVRAPFDGTLAKLSVAKGDTIGNGTAVGTLVAKQQIAELSLNEVDAAKVHVGQKATLTFDAVDGLSISGSVASVDTLGTVSQGVVTYAVKISFDTQDPRVKPGMSVNASIVTDVKSDVLAVPSSAVKTQGGTSYVEVFNPPLPPSPGNQGTPSKTAPMQIPVTVGASDDTNTEIVSGLKEGDQVVTRTITAQTTTAQTAPSLIGGGARGGAAGGTFRAGGFGRGG